MMYAYAVAIPSGRSLVVAVVALAAVMSGQRAQAQPGWVLSHQKISDTEGGFTGSLDNGDQFGTSVASLGDLDGDGVGVLAVGAAYDDDGGTNRGAVWVLFRNRDGTVKSHQKISDTEGGFTVDLPVNDRTAVAVQIGMNPVAFYFRSLTTSDWTKAGSPNMRSKKSVLMA